MLVFCIALTLFARSVMQARAHQSSSAQRARTAGDCAEMGCQRHAVSCVIRNCTCPLHVKLLHNVQDRSVVFWSNRFGDLVMQSVASGTERSIS